MKKLRLDLDNLKVDSFATTPDRITPAGTVIGQDVTDGTCTATCGYSCDVCYSYGPEATCNGNNTCDLGQNTCANGCGGSANCGTDTNGFCCSAACTQPDAPSCDGHTGCGCASTVACGSIDTFDCGGCHDTNYNNSCTDQGCTYCANAC